MAEALERVAAEAPAQLIGNLSRRHGHPWRRGAPGPGIGPGPRRDGGQRGRSRSCAATAGVATGRPTARASATTCSHQLDVRGLRRSGIVLEADADVAAALERAAREAAPDDVAADDGDRPRQVAAIEHLEVRVERASRVGGRPNVTPRGAAAPEIALVAAEVELHERAARQPAGAVIDQRRAQEARLEDRDARPEPALLELRDDVADVAVGVGVEEVDAAREAVRARADRGSPSPGRARPCASRPEAASGGTCAKRSATDAADADRAVEDRVGARARRPAATPSR